MSGERGEMPMQVTMLGTGAPNHPTRATTGMVVSAEGCEPLVIDTCGGFEFWRQLAAVNIPMTDIKHVLLTHRHLDHIGGMVALFIEQLPFTLYAQPETFEAVDGFMQSGFPEWELHPDIQRVPIRPGVTQQISGFTLEFFPMQHRVPTVAVRLQREGKTLAFSADGIPTDAMVECAREADLFICDALYQTPELGQRAKDLMHPTGAQAAEIATAASARSLLLTHFSGHADPAQILSEAQAGFEGPVEIAEDGITYAI